MQKLYEFVSEKQTRKTELVRLRLDSHSIVSTVRHILKQCRLDHTTTPKLKEKLEYLSSHQEMVIHDWDQLLTKPNSSHRHEEEIGEWMKRAVPIAQERLAISWPLKKQNSALASTLCSKYHLKKLDLVREWMAATKYGYLRMLEKLVDIDSEVVTALAGSSLSVGFARGLSPERMVYLHSEDTPLQWTQVSTCCLQKGLEFCISCYIPCAVGQVFEARVRPVRCNF